jgi:hypothetical protein
MQSVTHGRVNLLTHSGLLLALIAGAAFASFVLLYRLDVNPAPWHDEANFLKVAENYAERGVYATFSADGDRYNGAIFSTGPTVILPIAALYRAYGVDITLGRLVIVAYAVLAFAALYALGVALGDHRLALAALVLAFVCRANLSPMLWRNVMGEGPALFYLTAALAVWLRPGTRRLPALVLVGALIGLAGITKNQVALVVLPALLVVWLLDLFWYRRRGWRYFVVPGVVAGVVYFAWTYYLFFVLGADARAIGDEAQALQAAQGSAYFLFDPALIGANLNRLTGGDAYAGLLLPALAFGLVLSFPRSESAQRWGILLVIVTAALAFYVISVGWWKIAFPGMFLGGLLVARLLYVLTDGLRLRWATLARAVRGQHTLTLRVVVMVALLAFSVRLVLLPAAGMVVEVIGEGDDSHRDMAAYMQAFIPPDALVETWEEELAVLTDHNLHSPPQLYESYVVKQTFLNGPTASRFYDFRDYGEPDYVIVGPYAKSADFYPADSLTGYRRMTTIGPFDVYRRAP